MSRTVPSFAEEGLKRFLHGMDRRIKDLERGGSWRFDTEVEHPESSGGAGTSASPQLLSLSTTLDLIASGGDYVAFDTVVRSHGQFAATAGSSWVHPVSGVYVLTYEHAWTSYAEGGVIELELDGVVQPDGIIASGTDGRSGRGSLIYVAAEDAVGRIKVTQTSGVAQTCDAVMRVGISDSTISATAVSLPFRVTEAIAVRSSTSAGEVFVDRFIEVDWDGTGTLVLSGSSAGTGTIRVDDAIQLDITHEDGSSSMYYYDFEVGGTPTAAGPLDVTSHFEAGTNTIRLRLLDLYGADVESSAIWLAAV